MARGKEKFPPISIPHDAPRGTQVQIANIRERLEALEAAHDATAALAGKTALTVNSTTTTTTTTTVATTSYIAGVALTLPCAVVLQNKTNVGPADPTILASTFGCFGVAISSAPGVGTANPGTQVQVATAGQVISTTASFAAFMPVFCGPNGQLTQTPPSGPAVIQVGVAIAAQLVLVAPGLTLISAAALAGQPIDNLLGTTDVIWQFNGAPIAARRIADFVTAGGFAMAMQDDPGNNRVLITFGASVSPFGAQLAEDGWPWGNPDGLVDDEWDLWQDDSFANSSTVAPTLVLCIEDAWLDPDDTLDDWELLTWSGNEAMLRSGPNPLLTIEDGWQWSFDDTAEESESWQFDALANTSTVVGSAALSLEDAWFDPDDTEDPVMLIVLSCTTGWNQNG